MLGIIASPDFWGELPPDADIRTIGGLTVGSLVGDGNHNDVALLTCAMLNVTTSATIPTWDASVTDLLAESFTIRCTGFSVVYGRVIRPDTTHIETLQVAASVWPVAPDVDRRVVARSFS